MPLLPINDIQMYYEIHGEGQPLVIIGGLSSDLSDIEALTNWFAQTYRVLVFDNRGAGRTDKPDAPYSLEMMAADTLGLLHALNIERASIIGISMGGRIALDLALRSPESVEKLLLVSTSARVPGTRSRVLRLRLLGLISRIPFFKGKYPQPRYAFLHQLRASGAYNCIHRLHELTMPTLILHGKKDQTAPYPLAEELHAGISGSQLIPFKGGHLFFLFRERQAFLDACTTFLSH